MTPSAPAPVRFSRRDGLYRSVRWGRNAEVFFLDQRSFRSANADATGVCNNPQTGEPVTEPELGRSTQARMRGRRFSVPRALTLDCFSG